MVELIGALAQYEKEPEAAVATVSDLRSALFGDPPAAHALVAETSCPGQEPQVVGMALWYYTFSTWSGRQSLYLEDLYVEPAHRGHGHGFALMSQLAQVAKARGCARMDWSVLDWNEPARRFYDSLGAQPLDGWTTWRLEPPALDALATLEPGSAQSG